MSYILCKYLVAYTQCDPSSNPCRNDGHCSLTRIRQNIGRCACKDYKCTCLPGFTGRNCDSKRCYYMFVLEIIFPTTPNMNAEYKNMVAFSIADEKQFA